MKTRIVLLICAAFARAEECIIGQGIAEIQCSVTMDSVTHYASVEECSEHKDCCILDGECVARLAEPSCPIGHHWGPWSDRDDPSGSGDWETLGDLRHENPGYFCEKPKNMEARLVRNQSHWKTAREIVRASPDIGLVCKNEEQPDKLCEDYEVRFCCPGARKRGPCTSNPCRNGGTCVEVSSGRPGFVCVYEGNRCKPRGWKLGNPGCWDIDEKGNGFQVTSQSDCNQKKYNDRCCFRNATCEACNVVVEEDVCDTIAEHYNNTNDVISTYDLPWYVCMPLVTFADNCRPKLNEPYVLISPVDVPYCARIPCKVHGNRPLETSQRACSMEPGCYFDVDLFELRQNFGPSILPDVPVCHLAIRNELFRNNANTFVAEYGYWNPYYTNCLLTIIDEDLRKGAAGCELLPNLDAIYVTPKIAGWKTINSYECALIDGCWRTGKGCFYPPDFSRRRVKAAQREITFPKNENSYGRSKCQVFDPRSPLNILKSYHKCLSSGCAVDSSVTNRYYKYLYDLGMSMTTENHWKYWGDVERGHVGAYNIEAVLGEYGYGELSTTTTIPPPPTPTLDPFGFASMGSGEGGHNNPFGASSLQLYPQPQVDNSDCGPAFKQDGGRPCEPPRIDVGKTSRHSEPCPYRPILVPRFPTLSGKFDGCCDVDLCYLPKEEIPKARTRPSHYYTEWSMYSECSMTCGFGEQKRYRRCISGDRSKCTQNLVNIKPCFTRCSSWTTWSRYTPCSKNCYPGGIQTRRRECLSPEGHCAGSGKETRVCNKQKSCRG